MPRIQELLNSSVTAIVRYHEKKLAIAPSSEPETVSNILGKPHDEMLTNLTTLIEASTSPVETTRPLLMYLLHNIDLLRSFKDSTAPAETAELGILKQELIQFIVNIKNLFKIPETTKLPIHYSTQDDTQVLQVYGLMKGTWVYYALCDTGTILQGTLFTTLILPIDSTDELIGKTITGMVEEQHLLIREAAVRERESAASELERSLATRVKTIVEREKAIVASASTIPAAGAAPATSTTETLIEAHAGAGGPGGSGVSAGAAESDDSPLSVRRKTPAPSMLRALVSSSLWGGLFYPGLGRGESDTTRATKNSGAAGANTIVGTTIDEDTHHALQFTLYM